MGSRESLDVTEIRRFSWASAETWGLEPLQRENLERDIQVLLRKQEFDRKVYTLYDEVHSFVH